MERTIAPSRASLRRAFSLIELVIVVIIIGVISAIAIPRFSQSSDKAYASAMLKDWRELQAAAERFSAEHQGLAIGKKINGANASPALVVQRLTKTTVLDGSFSPSGLFGPYLDKIPANRDNSKNTIRIDGAAAGAGTHGWRLDTALSVFVPDTADGMDVVKTVSKTVSDLVGP